MRQKNNSRNQAVSEVVGEMLMIGIVLILAAVFTSQLPNYLPSERSPTVTIMMNNDTFGNVFFWHKGGDWVKVSDLRVVISNQTYQATYTFTGAPRFTFSTRSCRNQRQSNFRSRGKYNREYWGNTQWG